MSSILLTGASGYIGSEVLQRLLAAGHKVVCLSHSRPVAGCEGVEHCESLMLDLSQPDAASQLTDYAFDTVIHLAGFARARPERMQAINVQGTAQVLAAAKAAGVKHFVFVSSQDATAAIPTVYGHSKQQAEQLVKDSGLAYSIVRPGLVYGQGGGALAHVAGFAKRFGVYPRPGSGQQQWQPVQVSDLAGYLAQLVVQPAHGDVIAVAGRQAASQSRVFAETLTHANVRALPVPLPRLLLRVLRVMFSWHPLAHEMIGKLLLNAGDRLPPEHAVLLRKGFPDGL